MRAGAPRSVTGITQAAAEAQRRDALALIGALAVIRILNRMAGQYNAVIIIVVTHDEKDIPTFRRIYHIRDGTTHEEAGKGRGV
jgi:ABC-type lipoprotein export system ATPase subunit